MFLRFFFLHYIGIIRLILYCSWTRMYVVCTVWYVRSMFEAQGIYLVTKVQTKGKSITWSYNYRSSFSSIFETERSLCQLHRRRGKKPPHTYIYTFIIIEKEMYQLSISYQPFFYPLARNYSTIPLQPSWLWHVLELISPPKEGIKTHSIDRYWLLVGLFAVNGSCMYHGKGKLEFGICYLLTTPVIPIILLLLGKLL